ncbi:Endoplasmic reticulum transmembrane protein 3 [Collariella sp. IMI 366227]|nr:Endoplasmic reticulum transmembrane protein 3 [Collariella sp. IMI 366227]
MTLYYTLVFLLLVAEMALFMLLILPLPFAMRRRLFTFISENPIVAKIQYWLKITFVFILILFIDSVNRVYRVQVELAAATENTGQSAPAIMGHERLEVQARKFYSVLRLEEKMKQYEGTDKNTKQAEKLAMAGDAGELSRLKREVELRDQNIATLKKQAAGLHKEYDSLAERFGRTQEDGIPKKDK